MSEALKDDLPKYLAPKYLARTGKKGAAARNGTLTPEQRQELGRRVVQARWARASQSLAKPKKSS